MKLERARRSLSRHTLRRRSHLQSRYDLSSCLSQLQRRSGAKRLAPLHADVSGCQGQARHGQNRCSSGRTESRARLPFPSSPGRRQLRRLQPRVLQSPPARAACHASKHQHVLHVRGISMDGSTSNSDVVLAHKLTVMRTWRSSASACSGGNTASGPHTGRAASAPQRAKWQTVVYKHVLAAQY